MNYLPLKHGRGRPRHVVHFGRLSFPSDVDPSFGCLFTCLENGGFFDDSCLIHPVSIQARSRLLDLCSLKPSPFDLFSVTFTGSTCSLNTARVFFDVSNLVFLGVLPHESV